MVNPSPASSVEHGVVKGAVCARLTAKNKMTHSWFILIVVNYVLMYHSFY